MALTLAALDRKKPATDEVLFAQTTEQRDRLDLARKRVALVSLSSDEAEKEKAAEELEAAKADIRKTGIAFTLVSVGRERWDALKLTHRPTEEQQQEDADKPTEEQRTVNPDTFWPALLAELVPDSKLTAEQWSAKVFKNPAWNGAELEELRNRAIAVTQDSLVVELGN
jgi:hypothetical protein